MLAPLSLGLGAYDVGVLISQYSADLNIKSEGISSILGDVSIGFISSRLISK